MADSLVLTEQREYVRTITMHRPGQRNALSNALQRELSDALRSADADTGVRVVILTGSDPAFCAGLDLKELGAGTGTFNPNDSPFDVLWNITKPVIGAINGPCATGGLELALACDFLIASDHAKFGDTHARVGFTPAGRMSVLLPQAVGLRRAREMSFTGNFVDANEAHRLGLVNRVVPHTELLTAAQQLGADIAGGDQDAITKMKDLYDRMWTTTGGDAIEYELEVFRGRRLSAETIEARRNDVMLRGRSQ